MQKTKIYLIGSIFGFISSSGFIIVMFFTLSIFFNSLNNLKQISFFVWVAFGILGFGGVGAFVSGIIQIIKADEQSERTLAIMSGIFNIVGSAVLVGPILSLIVHIKQAKVTAKERNQ